MLSSQRKHKRHRGESGYIGSESSRKVPRLTDTVEPSHSDSDLSELIRPLARQSENSHITIDLEKIDSKTQAQQSKIVAEFTDLSLDDLMEFDPINVDFEQDDSIRIPTEQSLDSSSRGQKAISLSGSLDSTPYDVCFGMLVMDISASMLPNLAGDSIPVNARIHGDLLKFHHPKFDEYVGLLQSRTLTRLAETFRVSFFPLLQTPGENVKSPKRGVRKVGMHIVIYGLRTDFDAVGSSLSDDGLYLQHPSQFDDSVPYRNPHFLLPPGFEMPNHKSTNIETCPNLADTDDNCGDYLDRKKMHAVLQTFECASGPATYTKFGPSLRLKTQLQEHQMKALSMLIEKELGSVDQLSFPSLWDVLEDSEGNRRYRHTITGITKSTPPPPLSGGILADEMGLGKTLSLLAHIAWHLDSIEQQNATARATLVVTTLSTIPSWQQQIERHFHPGQLGSIIFHGPDRRKLSSDVFTKDVVITTYETLKSEWCNNRVNSHLFSETQRWSRVVLDEAHHIRNRSSKTFEAVCGVRANYRWCLTGTPIHNRLDDYGALLSFIRVDPFTGSSGKTVFSHWVSSSVWTETNNTERLDRLKKLVAATCLRRTKQNVRNQLSLPRRTDKEHLVELHSSERLLYDFFKTRASSIVARSTVHHAALERRGWGNILTIINSLRLICNHGEELLSSSSLELWKRRDTFTDDLNWHENTSQLSTGASRSHDPHDLPLPVTNSGQVSSKCCAPSSKVKALINNLRAEQNELTPNDSETPIKSVIFSYWTSMLDLIAVALRENGFEFERIDGQTPLERRLLALKTLHDDPKCTVMLASIGSIAEGVDLTAASRVHIIEPQWNPMVEAQALDRVHRMGQTRDVVTTRYIVKDSIETYVQDIQQAKLKLALEPFGKVSAQTIAKENRLQNLQKALV